MKSIVTKLRYCLALLMLGLFSFNASYAQDVPTDEEINELLRSQAAKTFEDYFAAQGYTDAGIIDGSQGASTAELAVGTNRATDADAATMRSVVFAKQFKSPSGELVDITYAFDKASNGVARIEVSAENASSSFFLVGGAIRIFAKATSFAQKFENCWKQYVGGLTQNCVNCYNCLKNAISGSSATWKKIWNALKCAGPCVKCIGGIVGFVYCVIK